MLLLDENLSPKLAARLDQQFPGTKHVLHVGLDNDEDGKIWTFANAQGFTIVTKDKDYIDFSGRLGHPPKVILLTIGNSRLAMLENLIKTNREKIIGFIDQNSFGLLNL